MTIEYIFILISLSAVGLAFLTLIVFGFRNLSHGKHSMFSVAALVVPASIFGACAVFTGGEMARSAILTVIIMSGLAILGLLYSGVRGLTG